MLTIRLRFNKASICILDKRYRKILEGLVPNLSAVASSKENDLFDMTR